MRGGRDVVVVQWTRDSADRFRIKEALPVFVG
jgi:hypothetical protein